MTDKVTFSNAVSNQLPYLEGMRHMQDKRRYIASGIGDEKGNPTEFVHFLDRLYGPCLEDVEFFWGQADLFRKIAAGKVIWEAQKRFPDFRVHMRHVCAIGAIIVTGTIHRRKCLDDFKPFYHRRHFWSDLLDEAAQLVEATRDIQNIPEGKKNTELAFLGIDPTKFRAARAEWSRMCDAIGVGAEHNDIGINPFLDEQVQMRCSILAGTHWVNTFERHGVLQDISVCSVLNDSKFDIQGYGPSDLVVVGWNFPLSAQDQEWDMDSEGYPLTMVTKAELEQHAPDLLEVPEVKEQLAGMQPPGWLKKHMTDGQ